MNGLWKENEEKGECEMSFLIIVSSNLFGAQNRIW